MPTRGAGGAGAPLCGCGFGPRACVNLLDGGGLLGSGLGHDCLCGGGAARTVRRSKAKISAGIGRDRERGAHGEGKGRSKRTVNC